MESSTRLANRLRAIGHYLGLCSLEPVDQAERYGAEDQSGTGRHGEANRCRTRLQSERLEGIVERQAKDLKLKLWESGFKPPSPSERARRALAILERISNE